MSFFFSKIKVMRKGEHTMNETVILAILICAVEIAKAVNEESKKESEKK